MVSEIIWIDVEEELPTESEGTVLVLMPNKFPHNQKEPFQNAKHNRRIQIAKYSEFTKRWYYGDLNSVCGDDPIAWARLPIFEYGA
jgi:hypothetical protein